MPSLRNFNGIHRATRLLPCDNCTTAAHTRELARNSWPNKRFQLCPSFSTLISILNSILPCPCPYISASDASNLIFHRDLCCSFASKCLKTSNTEILLRYDVQKLGLSIKVESHLAIYTGYQGKNMHDSFIKSRQVCFMNELQRIFA